MSCATLQSIGMAILKIKKTVATCVPLAGSRGAVVEDAIPENEEA